LLRVRLRHLNPEDVAALVAAANALQALAGNLAAGD
jgi:hypothetical protein